MQQTTYQNTPAFSDTSDEFDDTEVASHTATNPHSQFSLDDLLFESLAPKREKELVKDTRKRLLDSRVKGQEREEIEAKLRELDLALEWKAAATVAMFHTQECENCGWTQGIFTGMFQRHANKSNGSERWVTVPLVNSSLPIEKKEIQETTPICLNCAGDLGYFSEEEAEAMEVDTEDEESLQEELTNQGEDE
jgi:hypothetical protein